MRSIGVVAAVCGVVLLVAGCSVGGGDTAVEGESVTSAVHAESEAMGESGNPAAFHFDSGDLVIGPFDPEEVKDNLFDPCAEISDAELAEVGLAKSEVQPDQGVLQTQHIRSCALESTDEYESVLLVANAASRSVIEASSPIHSFDFQVDPEVFLFGPPSHSLDLCDAAVETTHGTFSVSVGTLRADPNLVDLCSKAASTLNSLRGLGEVGQ